MQEVIFCQIQAAERIVSEFMYFRHEINSRGTRESLFWPFWLILAKYGPITPSLDPSSAEPQYRALRGIAGDLFRHGFQ